MLSSNFSLIFGLIGIKRVQDGGANKSSIILSSVLIYDSLSLSLSRCVYVCVSISFFSDLWFFLSLYLSLSVCVYVCVSVSALLMLSVEVLGIAEIGPFFGLKPSRSSFHFLIFPIWLLRKWGKRVLFLVWNPIENEATPWVLAV